MEQNPKQQVVERIKSATNILVTVSTNPSVDQLAACIGFTLMLNKLGKHATAVFSGAVPSTLEFLQPEKTLEKNTDSLQDFIIALDKSKADKLRYKVEDDVVRIFITPYKTSISQKDLEFSLGDFNVDVVVALGVLKKEEIDQAIVAHGRILHDATVMTVACGTATSDVGSINWYDPGASSLSEMLVSISESFQSNLLDPQMATSFLTGIVAETERFSNGKTTPKVMTMSAQLMAAGANQQLIATKLAPPPTEAMAELPSLESEAPKYEEPNESEEPPAEPDKPDGEIDIPHEHEQVGAGLPDARPPEEPEEEGEIHIDDEGNLKRQAEMAAEKAKEAEEAAEAADDQEIANNGQNIGDSLLTDTHKVIDPLPGPKYDPLLPEPRDLPDEPALNLPPVLPSEPPAPASEPPAAAEIQDTETLAQLEVDVDSPHLTMVDNSTNVDDARQAVATANLDTQPRPQASQSLGAQPLDLGKPPETPTMPPTSTMTGIADILQTTSSGDPAQAPLASAPTDPAAPLADNPLAPPPVPPPMTAPYFEPKTSHHNPYLNPTDKPVSDEPAENPV